jgi:hypothetical protein
MNRYLFLMFLFVLARLLIMPMFFKKEAEGTQLKLEVKH